MMQYLKFFLVVPLRVFNSSLLSSAAMNRRVPWFARAHSKVSEAAEAKGGVQ